MTIEVLLPVAFLAGLFGSGHCVGMCGPVVILLEDPRAAGPGISTVGRRIAYNVGRLGFYTVLGAVAGGAAGLILTRATGLDVGLSILRLLAAALVVALGLNLLFDLRVLRYLEAGGMALWRRLSPLARHVLPLSTPTRAVAAGFLWGALPCGLVYSAVAIAATSGSAAGGALVMLGFWLGTLPALLLIGASARKLGQWSRRSALRRATGAMMMLLGTFALALPYLHTRDGAAGSDHVHAGQTEGSPVARPE